MNENTPIRREVKQNEVDINPQMSCSSSQKESFKVDSQFNKFDKTRTPVKRIRNNKKESEIKFQISINFIYFTVFLVLNFT